LSAQKVVIVYPQNSELFEKNGTQTNAGLRGAGKRGTLSVAIGEVHGGTVWAIRVIASSKEFKPE
jgi:hypothetical protein